MEFAPSLDIILNETLPAMMKVLKCAGVRLQISGRRVKYFFHFVCAKRSAEKFWQHDWFAPYPIFLATNHVAEFLFSLRAN